MRTRADGLVGVASCGCLESGDRRAEFAVFVAGAHRGRGIGTLLLEHLAARARRHGIEELIGEVLPGNTAMLRVAHDLRPDAWSRFDAGVVDVGLAVVDDETVGAAVDARDRTGADRPVGRRRTRRPGRRRAHRWRRAGVRGAVVLSAGFAEEGPHGRRLQYELVRLARRHGIRLIGPNCLGVVNTDPSIRLNACFAPHEPSAGGLAVAAQSGAVGIALLEQDLGVSTFVSLGNKADVSGNDLVAY